MTVQRVLNTVGKRTFVNCFEKARERIGIHGLSKKEVVEADLPDSKKWKESSLATKTSNINRIFREGKECQALQICCKAEKLDYKTREKAEQLYKQYCKGCC